MPAPEYQRLLGWSAFAGDHLQHVFGIKVQLPGQVYLEVGVAVGVERQLLAVEPDFGVVVHALEFQHKGLALQGCIRGEAFFVKVIIALVPAVLVPPGAVSVRGSASAASWGRVTGTAGPSSNRWRQVQPVLNEQAITGICLLSFDHKIRSGTQNTARQSFSAGRLGDSSVLCGEAFHDQGHDADQVAHGTHDGDVQGRGLRADS